MQETLSNAISNALLKKLASLILVMLPLYGSSVMASQLDKAEIKSKALHNLDKILSPFEDLTEYALKKDFHRILESFYNIKHNQKNSIFKENMSSQSFAELEDKIEILHKYMKERDYKNIAQISSDIFHYNANHFVDSKLIKEQIHLENMDYMGFRLLALLNIKKIDYKEMRTLFLETKTEWNIIRNDVKNTNSIDAFNLLFDGLTLSVKNKNNAMIEIFARMDLAFVDVIEKDFE